MRGNGSGLYVHMIPSDANWAQGNQRVVTSAGCEVSQSAHASHYELKCLRGDASGQGPIALDTLVYRAFDVLVTAHAQHLLDAR